MAYTVYRSLYPQTFAAASHHTEVVLGGTNTGILLFSSALMALAVRAAEFKNRKQLVWLLLGTAFLGIVFMAIKSVEYHKDFVEHLVPGSHFEWHEVNRSHAEIFFWLYFAVTGLHAIHVTVGIFVLLTLAVLAWLGKFTAGHHTPVEVAGLYWHFVDWLRESGLVQPGGGVGNFDFESLARGALLHAHQGKQSSSASRGHRWNHLAIDSLQPHAGRLFHPQSSSRHQTTKCRPNNSTPRLELSP